MGSWCARRHERSKLSATSATRGPLMRTWTSRQPPASARSRRCSRRVGGGAVSTTFMPPKYATWSSTTSSLR